VRDAKWTENVDVGRPSFLEKIKERAVVNHKDKK